MFIQIVTTLTLVLFPLIGHSAKINRITSPLSGRRCQQLKEKYNYKINYKLKLAAMLNHNLELQKRASSHKLTLRERLKQNHQGLEKQLQLTTQRLGSMEENMIRKGCPGVRLQHASSELDSLMKILQ